MDLIQKKTYGGKVMNKKANILLAVGVLALIIGVLLNIIRDPLVWGTGIVILLFTTLLCRLDPLKASPKDK
jgi:hypothetical protein